MNNEDYLYVHSRCHIRSPTWAKYNDDELIIECAECGKMIARFLPISEEAEEKEPWQTP